MNQEQFLRLIEEAATYGLLEEVRTTPKPGLVDLHDNGSHKDMNYDTFVASTAAIVPYITRMAEAGCGLQGGLHQLFPAIRPIGVDAEKAMFAATRGINTHKGMIFSLGIIAACLGFQYSCGNVIDPDRILTMAGQAVFDWLEQDFDRMKNRPPMTHGERLFAEYGYRGIRGEAQQGFPSLRQTALPAMKSALDTQPDVNRTHLYVLLTLMAQVDDTNVLIRSNPETLAYVKDVSQQFLRAYPVITDKALEHLAQMNQDFIARNISPGGCADLLAISIFFSRLGCI